MLLYFCKRLHFQVDGIGFLAFNDMSILDIQTDLSLNIAIF